MKLKLYALALTLLGAAGAIQAGEEKKVAQGFDDQPTSMVMGFQAPNGRVVIMAIPFFEEYTALGNSNQANESFLPDSEENIAGNPNTQTPDTNSRPRSPQGPSEKQSKGDTDKR